MSFHEILKFGCKMGDTEITNNLVLIGLIFTILQLIISLKIPAPYGRYNSIGPKFLTCKLFFIYYKYIYDRHILDEKYLSK